MMQNFNILHEFTKQHARQTSCIYSYYVERAVAVKNRSWWRGPGCCVRVKSTETCPHLTKRWRKNFPGGLWGKDELFARDNHFYLFLPAVFSLPSTFRPNWQSRTKLVIMASCTSLSLSLSSLLIFSHWSSHHWAMEWGRDTGERKQKKKKLFMPSDDDMYPWVFPFHPRPDRRVALTYVSLDYPTVYSPFWLEIFLHIISHPLLGLTGLVCCSVGRWKVTRKSEHE